MALLSRRELWLWDIDSGIIKQGERVFVRPYRNVTAFNFPDLESGSGSLRLLDRT